MTSIAFSYRRKTGDEVSLDACVGTTIHFLENVEYIIEHPSHLPEQEVARLEEVGFDQISSKVGILCFTNFVGTTKLSGVTIKVTSTKLGADGTSILLEEISRISSGLIYGWKSPTKTAAQQHPKQKAPVPYHQIQLLREQILKKPIGQRLQDYFSLVEQNPTRRFEIERRLTGVEKVRSVDSRSVYETHRHPEYLVPLSKGSHLSKHNLAVEKITKSGGNTREFLFPIKVSESVRKLSFDTPENRFVKQLLLEIVSVVHRLVDNPLLHEQMRAEMREMLSILDNVAGAQYLSEVGATSIVTNPTQALLKGEGYRELLKFWQEFSSHYSFPDSLGEVTKFLEGKDIALLYEYWVFHVTVEAVSLSDRFNGSTPLRISTSDLGESLAWGLKVEFSSDISVSFNASFNRSKGTAYSTPLRPDVILRVGEQLFALDAKYKMKWKDLSQDKGDDEATFLRADLYKMHTYRDAIHKIKASFLVYPGTEFAFFGTDKTYAKYLDDVDAFDGVGAIPATPKNQGLKDQFNRTINTLILSSS